MKHFSGTVYRGTQQHAITGVRKGLSFTYSLPTAIIWSARPGDVWQGTRFLRTTLIPDLRASGSEGYVKDFTTCVRYIAPKRR